MRSSAGSDAAQDSQLKLPMPSLTYNASGQVCLLESFSLNSQLFSLLCIHKLTPCCLRVEPVMNIRYPFCFVPSLLVPLETAASGLRRRFTCSPRIGSLSQRRVPSSVPSVSSGHCGLSLTQRRLRLMNNATGRLFLKASPQSLGFLGNSAGT